MEGHGADDLSFVGLCVCLLSGERRSEILGRWSLGLQLKNLNEGFNTKSPEIRPLAVGLLGVFFLRLTYEGIVLASIGAN